MINAVCPHKQAVLISFCTNKFFAICEWLKNLHDSESQLKEDNMRSKSLRPKYLGLENLEMPTCT